jgi:integrase/recombinase XerD
MSGKTAPHLSELVKEYLGYCRAKRLSPQTLRWYRQKLAQALAELAGQGISTVADLSATALQEVIHSLDNGARSSYTIKGYAQVLRGFLSYLEEEELIDPRLRKRVPLPKVSKRLIKTISEDTFYALLDAARYEVTPWLRQRDKAVLMLLWETGVRAQELCDLTRTGLVLDELDDEPYIQIVGKGDKERQVGPLSPACVRELRRYLRVQPRQPEEPLFLNRYRQPLTPSGLHQLIARLRDFAGLSEEQGLEIRPHVFRHSYAVRKLAGGMDIKRLSLLMGHSSVTTTEGYLRDFSTRQARQQSGQQSGR